jgi:hypothetical protein
VSINVLRKSFLTTALPNAKTVPERESLAAAMRHSTKTQTASYNAATSSDRVKAACVVAQGMFKDGGGGCDEESEEEGEEADDDDDNEVEECEEFDETTRTDANRVVLDTDDDGGGHAQVAQAQARRGVRVRARPPPREPSPLPAPAHRRLGQRCWC